MKRTALRGHALRSEGLPYERSDEDGGYVRSWHGWTGAGLCECGETSLWLASNNARKRWHAEHKAALRGAQSGEAS